jgi:hypothetical protein
MGRKKCKKSEKNSKFFAIDGKRHAWYTYGMEQKQLLPLGIQDFNILRTGNRLYVDKTALIYQLTQTNRAVFLSRPRRFGKSLLLSTIRYYFLGRKELFEGLAIEQLEDQSDEPWAEHPVLYFDFNGQNYTQKGSLESVMTNLFRKWEAEYGIRPAADDSLGTRFENIIQAAYQKTGKRVVVLVDEYDKSLLETMTILSELEEANRALFKGVFGVLKKADEFLQFYMFTGVTKFSKVSIFSDLNQLTDISLDDEYSTICGITQGELENSFAPYIDTLAKQSDMSREECLSELKRMYDGYHFSHGGEGMYNPYSLLNAFTKKDFGSYWFESGTPTFLINKLNKSGLDIRKFNNETSMDESSLKDYRPENPDPTPLFYQSGYLTIHGWNPRHRTYKLGFPNAEVKYGFLKALAPSYLHVEDKTAPFDINLLDDAVEAGDTNGMRDWFTALFALLPYPAGKDTEVVTEQNFQNVIFMALTMMGKYARTEVHSAKGRADCVLETGEYVYIFEFKRDKSAADALAQIEEQNYAAPYSADTRRLFKIGVNFSTEERNIVEWEVR